jgi:radial spoke head protein 4A
LGSENDYYIVEAVVDAAEEEEGEEKDADFEPKGTGVNRFTYFVTTSTLNNWVKLPDLTPTQVKASRCIKILFTGDLEHNICTNPSFDGLEKHYLRA